MGTPIIFMIVLPLLCIQCLVDDWDQSTFAEQVSTKPSPFRVEMMSKPSPTLAQQETNIRNARRADRARAATLKQQKRQKSTSQALNEGRTVQTAVDLAMDQHFARFYISSLGS